MKCTPQPCLSKSFTDLMNEHVSYISVLMRSNEKDLEDLLITKCKEVTYICSKSKSLVSVWLILAPVDVYYRWNKPHMSSIIKTSVVYY